MARNLAGSKVIAGITLSKWRPTPQFLIKLASMSDSSPSRITLTGHIQ
ncbi:MAG: hypothetical protein M3Y39_09180 [Chloroflexota bacterium]|nr:hypothetical protein [Chloroflexota bacterium]